MKTWLKITLGVLVFIGVVLAIALPLAAQATLESTEVGLDYNASSKKLDETTLYEAGRHSIGVAARFITFKTDIQALQFDGVRTRTKDGLIINLNVSFQYKLKIQVDNLVELNYNFPDGEQEQAYIKICRNVFRDVTAKYPAYDFIDQRSTIQTELNQQTTSAINEYGAIVQNFQLLDIHFPSEFQNTISVAQNARLEIEEVENEKIKAEQTKIGMLEQAEVDKQTKINQADTEADRIQQDYIAKKAKIEADIGAKVDGYKSLIELLQLNADDIIKYTWGKSIDNLVNSQGFTLPVQLNTPSSVSALFTP